MVTRVVPSDRAAHDWAVEAMVKDPSLGVEVIATSAAPGQHLVQVQVWGTAPAALTDCMVATHALC